MRCSYSWRAPDGREYRGIGLVAALLLAGLPVGGESCVVLLSAVAAVIGKLGGSSGKCRQVALRTSSQVCLQMAGWHWRQQFLFDKTDLLSG
jgi:hypothetical protein